MPTTWLMGDNSRWEVIWWSKKKKAFTVKTFGNDLAGAEALYARVCTLRAPFATLRCCNVGFPPPEQYRPRMERQPTGRTRIVKRKGKRYRKTLYHEVEVVPMKELNLKGIWWCPYCRQMRKFRRQDGMTYTQGGHTYRLDGEIYVDPVCGTTHRNHHVRKWNPSAQLMQYRQSKRRRGNGRATRRRTRKR